MADDKGRDSENGGTATDEDEGEDSADIEAQLKALQAKKDAADKRAAAKREKMNDEDFGASKPKEPGKFDGEVKEPGWRWDRSRNDWYEHRGVDFSKRTRATMPHNFEHQGNGTPENPHRVEQVQRWM